MGLKRSASVEYHVDHIHLICPDIEPVKQWYCGVFNARVTFESTFRGAKLYYLDLNGFTLILIEKLPEGDALPADLRTREGLDHFGVEVPDLDSAVIELRAKGVNVVVEPMEVRPGLRIAYIEAPYKVRIELSERR
jgi:catechol 2,3-dioxygenase-like lactoylglutathione lyase family enzyme